MTDNRRHSLGLDSVQEEVDDVVATVASTTADRLRGQPWILAITKIGWAAKAVVYGSIGWAAIVIATNRPGRSDAEYTGIVALLADRWWARILLLVIAAGLVFYIAFRVFSVLLIDSNDLDGWSHRIGYAASAATYTTIAWAAFDGAITGTHDDGGSSIERFSAELLGSSAGRALVGLGALAALGVAGYFAYKGVARRFLRQLDLDGVGLFRRRLLEWGGAIGWIGRAFVVAAVAVFLMGAALQADPGDARGLDRALQEVAVSSTVGSSVVFLTGVLMILYACFCAASAPHRRLAWSSRHDPEPKGGPTCHNR